ncbi:MAG: tetratricopeptide (TPR) repeat protein [Planctomycetota bacterium]|jgi:tetratricopeptide (TPR) repeat protein
MMNIRQYLPEHAITTIPALALIAALHFLFFADNTTEPGIELRIPLQTDLDSLYNAVNENKLDVEERLGRLNVSDGARQSNLRDLLNKGDYKIAITRLLEVAGEAAENEDKAKLGNAMLLLGEVAIAQQELASAEIYLQEALYLAMSADDVIGSARVYQQLGFLNIKARALARQASHIYDKLWQARNMIARGLYRGVDASLESVIDENISIKRFGAAADAWEARAQLYDQQQDSYPAQLARIEAAKLYAAVGQQVQSNQLLAQIDKQLISDTEISQITHEIGDLVEAYHRDELHNSQARDYQMLYHHYQRSGDIKRAWEFRVKASETLAETTDRSLFQRQADILAVLYNSNFAMERARLYLGQAGEIFGEQGVGDLSAQTSQMESLIY